MHSPWRVWGLQSMLCLALHAFYQMGAAGMATDLAPLATASPKAIRMLSQLCVQHECMTCAQVEREKRSHASTHTQIDHRVVLMA